MKEAFAAFGKIIQHPFQVSPWILRDIQVSAGDNQCNPSPATGLSFTDNSCVATCQQTLTSPRPGRNCKYAPGAGVLALDTLLRLGLRKYDMSAAFLILPFLPHSRPCKATAGLACQRDGCAKINEFLIVTAPTGAVEADNSAGILKPEGNET